MKRDVKIFVSVELEQRQRERLASLVGDAQLYDRSDFADNAAFEPNLDNCDVVFGNVPADWLPVAKQLRWMQLESVGFGEYRHLEWTTLGKQLTLSNLTGFFSDAVAQTALGGILAQRRGLAELTRLKEQRHWRGEAVRMELDTLSNARVVLFGHGSINRRLAELMSPFGCRISTFTREWAPNTLDAALASADIVVCAAPETDETVGVFDRLRLGRIKPGGLFVNVGRGSVVDEDALLHSLESGLLGGAVLDVTAVEPLPQDHPLWAAPNTLLTQHTGGGSGDELDAKIDWFVANLARYRDSTPLIGVVDFKKGY